MEANWNVTASTGGCWKTAWGRHEEREACHAPSARGDVGDRPLAVEGAPLGQDRAEAAPGGRAGRVPRPRREERRQHAPPRRSRTRPVGRLHVSATAAQAEAAVVNADRRRIRGGSQPENSPAVASSLRLG